MNLKLATVAASVAAVSLLGACTSGGGTGSGSPAAAGDQESGADATPASRAASEQDKSWMMSNAETDLAEIAAGRMATEKGASAQVRAAGESVMNDHQQVLDQLKPIALRLGIALPATPNPDQQQQAQQLQTATGPAFDMAFLQAQLAGHNDSINQTQREIQAGTDPQLKQFAQDYLGKAQRHLQMIQQDQQQLGG